MAIGEEMGLVLAASTWKRVIMDVKPYVVLKREETGPSVPDSGQKPARVPANKRGKGTGRGLQRS
jgi:hypothetical protein